MKLPAGRLVPPGFRFFGFRYRYLGPLWFLLACFAGGPFAADLRIYPGAAFHVLGNSEDEWRFETTTDLVTWTDAPEMGSMFSDDRARALTNRSATQYFFRATKTRGLFDDRLLRTFHLTFAVSNWQTRLASGRLNGSNTLCSSSITG